MQHTNPIGHNIRMWLRFKDIKQETLARSLHISFSAMSQIINGKIKLSEARKEEIANLLNITTSQLNENPQQLFDNINKKHGESK